MNTQVKSFIDYVESTVFKDRSYIDGIVTAHLYHFDIHQCLALGQPAIQKYCPTFDKAWVDVLANQDALEPGHPSINQAILLALVEDKREVSEKAFELGLIPVGWHGWHPAMRHPESDLLGWLNARLKPEPDCSGLLYYATAVRLGQVYWQLIDVPYLEAVATVTFPLVTKSLLDLAKNNPDVQEWAEALPRARPDLWCLIL